MLNILSDLHLEHHKHIESLEQLILIFPQLKHNDDINNYNNNILILAGDIGNPYMENYYKFIKYFSNKYKHVLLVSGNHEYYNMHNTTFSIDQIDEHIRIITKDIDNLHFLQKNYIVIDDVKYVGTTMWTYVPKEKQNIIYNCMNDYNFIYNNSNNLINVDDIEHIHKNQLKWLENEIEKDTMDTVIITHHLPSKQLIHKKLEKI